MRGREDEEMPAAASTRRSFAARCRWMRRRCSSCASACRGAGGAHIVRAWTGACLRAHRGSAVMDDVSATRTTIEPTAGDASEETARLGRGELLAIGLFWLFLALLSAANRLLEPRRPGLAPGFPTGPIGMAVA